MLGPRALAVEEGQGALGASSATFEGTLLATLEDVVAIGRGESAVLVRAERALVRVPWTESFYLNRGANELVLAKGAEIREIEGATLLVRAEAVDGLITLEAPRAEATPPRFAIGVRATTDEARFRARGAGDAGFGATLGEGEFALPPPADWRVPQATLHAFNATLEGDYTARVGYAEHHAAEMRAVALANTTFVSITLWNATVTSVDDAPPLLAAAGAARVEGEGRATFRGAAGWVAEESRAGFARAEVAIDGAFVADGRAPGPRAGSVLAPSSSGARAPAAWTLSGEFREVRVGGAVVLERAPVAVAGSAAAMLAFYALFSRLGGDGVLAHPARRAIFSAVARAPGRAIADVERESGVSGGRFRYHLGVLRAHLLVRLEKRGKYVVAFLPAVPSDARPLLGRMGRASAILARLAESPATARDLSRALSASHQLVYHHLGSLVALGLVTRDPGTPATYRLATHPEGTAPSTASS